MSPLDSDVTSESNKDVTAGVRKSALHSGLETRETALPPSLLYRSTLSRPSLSTLSPSLPLYFLSPSLPLYTLSPVPPSLLSLLVPPSLLSLPIPTSLLSLPVPPSLLSLPVPPSSSRPSLATFSSRPSLSTFSSRPSLSTFSSLPPSLLYLPSLPLSLLYQSTRVDAVPPLPDSDANPRCLSLFTHRLSPTPSPPLSPMLRLLQLPPERVPAAGSSGPQRPLRRLHKVSARSDVQGRKLRADLINWLQLSKDCFHTN